MELVWRIDAEDVAKVKSFYGQHCDNAFVQNRIATNLANDKPAITIESFWDCMVGCLLTTQQRSGPDSAVSRFMLTKPLPLRYETCRGQDNLSEYAATLLKSFGGLRRFAKVGDELATNLSFLLAGGWEPTSHHLDEVRLNSGIESERNAATFIDDNYKGFGPKQSRNLLQGLGISRFEIPIDSRITKWLNAFGFPVTLSSNALQDRNYYNFVSDGFQHLCKACDIMPCVLDAVIFSSFDDGKWTEENVVW